MKITDHELNQTEELEVDNEVINNAYNDVLSKEIKYKIPNVNVVFTQKGRRKDWEDEWKEVRRSGIGGSDVGALLGFSKWKGPIEVFMDKTGLLRNTDTSFKAMCGTILEDLIRVRTEQILREDFSQDVEIKEVPYTFVSSESGYEFMMANIDGEINGLKGKKGPGLFEAKTASVYFTDDWKDGNIPMSYIAQMQWYMGILGYEWGVISYSIDNRDPEYTIVDFDQELFDLMKETSKQFWDENVMKKEIPSPVGLSSCQKAIEQIYPNINKYDSREINDSKLEKLLRLRKEASHFEASYKKEKDRLTQEIELILGETGKAKCFDWSISYYEVNRKGIDSKKLKIKYPEIYEELSTESSYRVVRATQKK